MTLNKLSFLVIDSKVQVKKKIIKIFRGGVNFWLAEQCISPSQDESNFSQLPARFRWF